MNLWELLKRAIQSKILPLLNELGQWKNPVTIKVKMLGALHAVFDKVLDVRPKHKDDYYTVLGWLISKKLAYAILIGIGILSITFVLDQKLDFMLPQGSTIRTYDYDSILLRFQKGRVRIRAKSGYLAYEGEVLKGRAEGEGSLFLPTGELLYQGEFANSQFSGTGALYRTDRTVEYQGEFQNNLFEGNGSLFRKNGSVLYEGAFHQGYKEGYGVLFDTGSNMVYQGNFHKDQILFSDFLGKSTEEIAQLYQGKRIIYADADYFAVALKEIDAIYYGYRDSNTLDAKQMVEGVYVLSDVFYQNGEPCSNMTQLTEQLGTFSYEGNSAVTMPEAVAIAHLNDGDEKLFGAVDMQTESSFDDVVTVLGYDTKYLIYLYSLEEDGLLYTFFCKDKMGEFDYYRIEGVLE